MSPAATGLLILFAALALDWGGIGPSSIRDDIAFIFAMCGAHSLWANTEAVDVVARLMREGLTDIMGALGVKAGPQDAAMIVTAIVSGLALVGILALWPDGHPDDDTDASGQKRSGVFRSLASRITLKCRHDRRINPRVWFIAVPLGALAPLAGGLIGSALDIALGFGPGLISAGLTALLVTGGVS